MKKGGILSPVRPPRAKYCGEPKMGAGGKLVMKLDMVAPAGPSVVMYAIGCFRRAALDITHGLELIVHCLVTATQVELTQVELTEAVFTVWYGF